MSIEKNVQIVNSFLAALGRRDKQGLLALSAEDIEWIIPGEDWPLAGTHRGHAGLENLLQKANETVETSFPEPPEFIAQVDRVLVVGFARGRIKATNRTFEDHWGSPWLALLLTLDVVRQAAIPYTDSLLNRQYVPLRCVTRVHSFELLSETPKDNRLPVRVNLEIQGLGPWQRDLSVYLPTKEQMDKRAQQIAERASVRSG
jgi:hypothetical protein